MKSLAEKINQNKHSIGVSVSQYLWKTYKKIHPDLKKIFLDEIGKTIITIQEVEGEFSVCPFFAERPSENESNGDQS